MARQFEAALLPRAPGYPPRDAAEASCTPAARGGPRWRAALPAALVEAGEHADQEDEYTWLGLGLGLGTGLGVGG